jgi:hypothetical protein
MQNTQMIQAELNKWLAYVNYGQYTNFVVHQATQLLVAFPNFKPCVESMQYPGEQGPSNLLMFKGQVKAGSDMFAIKIILINGFPYRAPKAYVDQQLNSAIIKAKTYLGAQNEITLPYLTGWNMSN